MSFADRSFFRESAFLFLSFPFQGARLESSKVKLSSSILQRRENTIIGSDFMVKWRTMKWDWVCKNVIESNILAVFSFLFIATSFLAIMQIVKARNRTKLFCLIYQLIFSKISMWKYFTCKSYLKKSQNCRRIQNHDQGF